MGKINMIRVLLGGLLAGVVINVFEALGGVFYMEDMTAALEAHGLSMPMTAGSIIVMLLMGFIAGLVAVWFYAAVRPRLGPGPKTAVIVACVLWVGGYFLALVGYHFLGLYPGSMLFIWGVISLVEMILATVAGAWLYREE